MVMATTHADGPTQILPVLVGDAGAVPHAPSPRSSLLASQPNANGTSSRASVTLAQRTPRIQCAPNPQCLSLAPHHQQEIGKNHLPRGKQLLQTVVGAGVVVEVEVGAEDGGKGEGEAKVHKEIQTQIQNLQLQ